MEGSSLLYIKNNLALIVHLIYIVAMCIFVYLDF